MKARRTATTTADLEFEPALEQLEKIIDDLEHGEPELSAALAKYEQAVRLLAHCHALIDGAEQAVAVLSGVDEQGRPVTTPFDAAATVEPPREPARPPARKPPPNSANYSRSPDSDNSSAPF
jgi:exodeoxyribonuclease VII small subunit